MSGHVHPLSKSPESAHAVGWRNGFAGLLLVLRIFSRRHILVTILVAAAAAGMARLGIWQLDRLEQRRSYNARVQAQLDRPALHISAATLEDLPRTSLTEMEYRSVTVSGEYDHANQVALRNQARDNQWGVRLLTPLIIQGSQQAVLIDRGWVPTENFTVEDWSLYDEPGVVQVSGVIRASQSKPDFGRRADPILAPGEGPLKLWYFANVERIAEQLSYTALPIYIQQAPQDTWSGLPHRSQPELELTEGPHMGYALQWFSFAVIAIVGYISLVYKHERAAGLTRPASTRKA